MTNSPRQAGFTLIEVLIALSITAFVATIAYTSLEAVMNGVESSQTSAERVYQVNRAWMIISRDLEQFVSRPVRDEYGELEPALQGGPAARYLLSFTRAGWHNPLGHPRAELQRVNYRVEDNALWRDSYSVLDRSGETLPQAVKLLDGVVELQLAFLDNAVNARSAGRGTELETRNWAESWVADTSQPEVALVPPQALELRLELEDWGEMRRIYALPPL